MLLNKAVATLWNYRFGFEMCEDDLSDAAYFKAAYNEAIELCAHLCKLYGLTEKDIIGHYEGHQKGIARNHEDPKNWFPKHGKSMDTFRDAVKALLNTTVSTDPTLNDHRPIQTGDLVKIIGAKYYSGKQIPDWVKKINLYVYSINGNRIVLNKDENHKHEIMSPFKITDLTSVSAISEGYIYHKVIKGDSLWILPKGISVTAPAIRKS